MRDAVSLLDQCSVCADIVNAETVSATAGIAGREYLYDILEAVYQGNAAKALSVAGSLYDMSKDLTRLCEELIMQLRNIMLLKVSPETADKLIIGMPDELKQLKNLAEKSDIETVMNRLSQLQECRERMSKVMNRRVEFEMALIKLCGNAKNNPETIDNSEIYDKIKQLEHKISSVSSNRNLPVGNTAKPEVLSANNPAADAEPVPSVDLRNLKPSDLVPCTSWNEVLEEFKNVSPSVAGSLEGSTAAVAGNVIFITAQNRFFITLFKNKENAVALGETIAKVLGQRFVIRARCAVSKEQQQSMAEKLVKKAIDSSIETAVENN